jgi:DNA-binding MarR family transcriptional regulator
MDQLRLLQAQYCISSNLRKACRVVTQMYAEILEPTGLQKTQFTLLVMVAILNQSTVSDLADMLVMDQTTVTRGLDLLKRQGLIETLPGEDRRTRLVTLTSQGEEMLVKAMPLWEQAQAKMLGELGTEKGEKLLELLSEVVMIAQKT